MDRINQPITGICSFAKYPICTDLDQLDADMAILGVPYDLGVGFLSGSRLAPRRIREASTQYARGEAGFYNFETDEQLLAAPIKIMDCGDADILQGDLNYSFEQIEYAVRKIIEKGAIPIVIGGDHSISIPVGRALESIHDNVSVVQFDAHLDWTDHVGPQIYGNGSPMRRLSEMEHIDKMAQIGLRGIGSSKESDFMEAKAYGSQLISAREVHKIGVEGVLKKIPKAEKYFVTVDIDGYDMSIAPGVASPYPGGLFYDQVIDIFEGICQMGEIVAIDLVEVAPQYDPTGITVRLAALTLISMMAQVAKHKKSLL
ncbi:agmatinase [Clostridium aminobutyricum]|uniref:Agmatinase n=1 Tax=Clostridium aminobutyricum TaxID=33953 RepID=A0A939IJ74_CLOAM|nr:agmatinase [Clostridium aminobutyricum]MBN7773279.1 agmatinase [Clostridium aminobutyricum]